VAADGSPLAGLVVVALEQAVAAPLCSRHLADLGAEVIKVERIDGGDFARDYDTYVDGMSTHFVWLNRNKRSIALDLKSPTGRDVLLRLLDRADIFLSNLAPGALDRLIPDETIAARNPMLIRCAISGYGPDGPYEQRKAFDLLVQGEAGVTASTGEPGHPAKPGVSLADLGGGIYATTRILAALHQRQTTGRGTRLHIAMLDLLIEWMAPLLLAFTEGGVEMFVEQSVSGATRRLTARQLTCALDAAGVPWGMLNGIHEVADHPQLADDDRWVHVGLPGGTQARVPDSPFRFGSAHETGRPPEAIPRVPGLGEHGRDILQELGYSDQAIDMLVSRGEVSPRSDARRDVQKTDGGAADLLVSQSGTMRTSASGSTPSPVGR
jgi:crotonobetainyl-CoA:carnitine CoA-transferase CaiB-like acyl-CoA transferase